MLSTTVFLAAAMQCAASVHPSTALDVARVESGLNPYAIAEILPGGKGVTSHFPTSKDEAVSLTGRLAAQGRRYSVGLMQITSTNFRHYRVSARDLLNPCTTCPFLSASSPTATAAAVPSSVRSVATTQEISRPANSRNPRLTTPATSSASATPCRRRRKTGSDLPPKSSCRKSITPPPSCVASLPITPRQYWHPCATPMP